MWTLLTLWILAWRAASCLQGILCPSVFLSEAPTFGDLVGAGLNPALCSRGLSFPFGKRGFGWTGEHLVLQAGLPTADSKRRHRTLFNVLICLIQRGIEQILPLQKCKIGNVLQKKEPWPQTSRVEHTGGVGVSQAAGSYKHARVGSKVTTHISKRWSRSVQKKKKEKVTQFHTVCSAWHTAVGQKKRQYVFRWLPVWTEVPTAGSTEKQAN